MKLFKSKLFSVTLFITLITLLIIRVITEIPNNERTLTMYYFITIISIITMIISILIGYYVNLVSYRFIVGKSIHNKITFLNFILLQANINILIMTIMIIIFKLNNSWISIFNPFTLILQVIFFNYLVKFENGGKKSVFVYILFGFLFTIIFNYIKM
ncbi:hypothetical protein P9J83_17315 [Clostridium sporogenes]|uniref:Uncharacterized protein n=1 Tax=Clostridium sporogenes TaxID=1509 RepID=A0AAE4JUH2_CLOSG|nr:hypothetical protein [Clostridium sporogenes]MDS1005226.1 hypothetical protein [Clostridium sporogenes]